MRPTVDLRWLQPPIRSTQIDLGGVTRVEPKILADLCARYGLDMDPGSVPGLVERFGLRFPGEPI